MASVFSAHSTLFLRLNPTNLLPAFGSPVKCEGSDDDQ